MFTGFPPPFFISFPFLSKKHSGHENNGMSRKNKTEKLFINAQSAAITMTETCNIVSFCLSRQCAVQCIHLQFISSHRKINQSKHQTINLICTVHHPYKITLYIHIDNNDKTNNENQITHAPVHYTPE